MNIRRFDLFLDDTFLAHQWNRIKNEAMQRGYKDSVSWANSLVNKGTGWIVEHENNPIGLIEYEALVGSNKKLGILWWYTPYDHLPAVGASVTQLAFDLAYRDGCTHIQWEEIEIRKEIRFTTREGYENARLVLQPTVPADNSTTAVAPISEPAKELLDNKPEPIKQQPVKFARKKRRKQDAITT